MQLEEQTSLELANVEENYSSFSLRDVLRVLFRHKWKGMIFFISTVVITTMIVSYKPDIYESHAKLLIKPGRENISWDASVLGPNITLNRQKSDLSAELAILTGELIVEKVVDKIGPEALLGNSFKNARLTPREVAAKLVKKNLNVKGEKNNQIINLSFLSQSPRLARDVLNNLINFYVEIHIEVHQVQETTKFFQEQSEKLLVKLLQKEEQSAQLCNEYGVVSLEAEKEALLTQISDLHRDINDADSEIHFSQGKITWLEKSLQESSATTELSRISGMPDPIVDLIKKHLLDLRFEEVDLVARYPDTSRVLIDLRKQISFAESELANEKEKKIELTTGIDTNYQAMRLELETERAQRQAQMARRQFLEGKLDKGKADLDALASCEIIFSGLQREIDIARTEYTQYRDNYQRAKISAALDAGKISNVSILQPANMPIEPLKSKKRRNVALGVLMGLFGAVGIAYVREFLDDSVKTNEDVNKRLGLPVLITVSYKEVEPS